MQRIKVLPTGIRNYFFLLALMMVPVSFLFAQQKLPVIKAGSTMADIRDGDDFQKGIWHILPDAKPDIYHANRSKRSKPVTFRTDSDSITFTVEPDKTYDFIILLNGKDSAYTRISTFSRPGLSSRGTYRNGQPVADTIAFRFGRGNKIFFKGTVNNSAPLDLMFDSGSNQVVLSEAGLSKGVPITFDDHGRSVAFGGSTGVQSSLSNMLQIANLTWDNVPIVKIENADGDGIVGYPVFDGKTVEIDYDKKIMIVHPTPVDVGNGFAKMEMKFKGGLPFIEATLQNGGKEYRGYFEFDAGSNGSLWLNRDFAEDHDLYGTTEKIGETVSQGLGRNSIRNHTVIIPKILIGGYELNRVPVDLELPSGKENLNWGIFGMDILKRFNVLLDFENDYVYLKPNTLMHEPYRKPFDTRMLLMAAALAAGLLITGLYAKKKWSSRKQLPQC